MRVTADMHFVFRGLVVDVEVPVFDGEPEISGRLSPFQAKSVAARIRQKVKSLQSHPEIRRVAGTEAVLVVDPRLVPAESTCHVVAIQKHDPVENGHHWNGSLSGDRQGNGLVLRFEICRQCVSPCFEAETHIDNLNHNNWFNGTPHIYSQNCPSRFDDLQPPFNTPIPPLTQLTTPNGIRIQSAALPQYTFRSDAQSDRQMV